MTNKIPSTIINLKWIKGSCPNYQRTIYIDETNKRTYHKVPLCKWYINYTLKTRCEGAVNLIEKKVAE